MLEFLQTYQLDFMLILIGICCLLLFFSIIIKNLSPRHRSAFILLIFSAALLLLSDRYAYIFRGNTSELGYWMVRITNFVTFFSTISVVFFYNLLLSAMIKEADGGEKKTPLELRIVFILCIAHVGLLIISQFTGLFYTFDETNHYQREPLIALSYIAPLGSTLLQFSVVLKHKAKFGLALWYALMLFEILPLVSGIVQLFVYGLSISNITTAIMVITLYIVAMGEMNRKAEKIDTVEMDHLKEGQARMNRLLDQTATTLMSALDAKEEYTQGHSARVAKYARQIAEHLGKSEKECEEIYYAGLLHDIGKIGIPDEIINKKGTLTPEEYDIMKQHPTLGRQILSGITDLPYLAIGANYHHERYDGTGYPEGLKGDEIPELGRILAVADAYDAMSSNRSYRDAIPQQKIREEFIKNSGTQFDPTFAQIMQHLIDLDSEYTMKEKTDAPGSSFDTVIDCGNFREYISDGIFITPKPTTITFLCETKENGLPSLVLFDSLDAKVYTDEPLKTEMNYYEYGEIHFDGDTIVTGARKEKTDVIDISEELENTMTEYVIVAARYRDHALFTIRHDHYEIRTTIALPDSTRFLYAGITGENCHIHDIEITKLESPIGEHYIERIAEEVSYINVPPGDVPNVQIDGYRTDAVRGIPIREGIMDVSFHTMSLPTARLVWHTAFINIFSSDNKRVGGPNFKEFALIRLDGEYWDDGEGLSENNMDIQKTNEFVDWDEWKKLNRDGIDVKVHFEREGNVITTTTENAGISIHNITKVDESIRDIYLSLSGDQVALTNIRIKRE